MLYLNVNKTQQAVEITCYGETVWAKSLHILTQLRSQWSFPLRWKLFSTETAPEPEGFWLLGSCQSEEGQRSVQTGDNKRRSRQTEKHWEEKEVWKKREKADVVWCTTFGRSLCFTQMDTVSVFWGKWIILCSHQSHFTYLQETVSGTVSLKTNTLKLAMKYSL